GAGAVAAEARRGRRARPPRQPRRRAAPRARRRRAGGAAPGLPAAGVQPRGQHARLQVGGRAHLRRLGGAQGADRPGARAGAEHRMTTMRGTLFIVAAPSGAGKSSIVNACLARDPNIRLSISFTSRAPRPGERHAEHYNFVSAAEFERMVAAGDFFEYARVHGDWKGTARQSVEPQLAAGRDVLLEIDWQGARQVRERIPEA